MILVFTNMKKLGAISFQSQLIDRIRVIVTVSLLINIFLAGSELFAEFYSDSAHTVHISHLFGLHGASLRYPCPGFFCLCCRRVYHC
jgi:molybdopterin-containing oxidoreductase family membrane subunit